MIDLKDCIITRHSVRKYAEKKLSKEVILDLLETAVKAPTATNSQPWAFTIIQDINLLQEISTAGKKDVLTLISQADTPLKKYSKLMSDENFNLFYNAETLIIISGKTETLHPIEDCSLVAQNLMLYAHNQGLGTCWVGFATHYLNSAEMKEKLNIPPNYNVIAPIIVGYPEKNQPPIPNKDPQILNWL